jgi:hypothetical protein
MSKSEVFRIVGIKTTKKPWWHTDDNFLVVFEVMEIERRPGQFTPRQVKKIMQREPDWCRIEVINMKTGRMKCVQRRNSRWSV